MDPLITKIQSKSEAIFSELVSIRRHFHKYPELSFQEEQTSKKIQEILSKNGISYTTGWCKYGIVGLIEGNNPHSKIIALRADMDALPILESNDVEYKSTCPGVMHACGHDVHMTSLLGSLIILNELRDQFEGTVKFIFQPAEEKLPGGAKVLIEEGVLKNPVPNVILGQHVQPGMPVGQIGLSAGAFMASCDELYLTIKGKGGHAAQAHLCVDPIFISSQIINALQELISREKPASIPSVLSIGKIWSIGGATNIIPDEVKLEGTFRSLDENWRMNALTRIREVCNGVCTSYRASCELEIKNGYPCLLNNTDKTKELIELSKSYLGADQVKYLEPRLTSEDFAYYTHEIPAVFYRFGVGDVPGVHTSNFNIQETSIKFSSGLMAYLAMKM
jgi:amidohydrolase